MQYLHYYGKGIIKARSYLKKEISTTRGYNEAIAKQVFSKGESYPD